MLIEKFGKARRRLAKEGFVATARWAFTSVFYYPLTRWLDHRFDRRWGTDTTSPLSTSKYNIDAELVGHAVSYSASPDRIFVRFLRQQELDYSDFTFIDLGCGKGRTLLLASEFSFKKIIGVEIEPAVHAICMANIATYLKNSKVSRPPIEALCTNAGDFDFPAGNIFLYLFNPFDEYIMTQVAHKLRQAIESSARLIRIVYFHPNFVSSLLTLPNIKLISEEIFRDRKSSNNVSRVATYEIAPAAKDRPDY